MEKCCFVSVCVFCRWVFLFCGRYPKKSCSGSHKPILEVSGRLNPLFSNAFWINRRSTVIYANMDLYKKWAEEKKQTSIFIYFLVRAISQQTILGAESILDVSGRFNPTFLNAFWIKKQSVRYQWDFSKIWNLTENGQRNNQKSGFMCLSVPATSQNHFGFQADWSRYLNVFETTEAAETKTKT